MDIKIEGLDEVLKNLSRMVVNEEIENKALNKAGKIVQEAVKEEAPVDQGTLKKNIRLRRPRDGEVYVHSSRAYHAHLVEFGRSVGSTITKNGKRVTWGPTNPNPFFSRGFEKSKNEAKQAMVSELQKGLGL